MEELLSLRAKPLFRSEILSYCLAIQDLQFLDCQAINVHKGQGLGKVLRLHTTAAFYRKYGLDGLPPFSQ